MRLMKVDAACSGLFCPETTACTGLNSCGSDLVCHKRVGLVCDSLLKKFSYGL